MAGARKHILREALSKPLHWEKLLNFDIDSIDVQMWRQGVLAKNAQVFFYDLAGCVINAANQINDYKLWRKEDL